MDVKNEVDEKMIDRKASELLLGLSQDKSRRREKDKMRKKIQRRLKVSCDLCGMSVPKCDLKHHQRKRCSKRSKPSSASVPPTESSSMNNVKDGSNYDNGDGNVQELRPAGNTGDLTRQVVRQVAEKELAKHPVFTSFGHTPDDVTFAGPTPEPKPILPSVETMVELYVQPYRISSSPFKSLSELPDKEFENILLLFSMYMRKINSMTLSSKIVYVCKFLHCLFKRVRNKAKKLPCFHGNGTDERWFWIMRFRHNRGRLTPCFDYPKSSLLNFLCENFVEKEKLVEFRDHFKVVFLSLVKAYNQEISARPSQNRWYKTMPKVEASEGSSTSQPRVRLPGGNPNYNAAASSNVVNSRETQVLATQLQPKVQSSPSWLHPHQRKLQAVPPTQKFEAPMVQYARQAGNSGTTNPSQMNLSQQHQIVKQSARSQHLNQNLHGTITFRFRPPTNVTPLVQPASTQMQGKCPLCSKMIAGARSKTNRHIINTCTASNIDRVRRILKEIRPKRIQSIRELEHLATTERRLWASDELQAEMSGLLKVLGLSSYKIQRMRETALYGPPQSTQSRTMPIVSSQKRTYQTLQSSHLPTLRPDKKNQNSIPSTLQSLHKNHSALPLATATAAMTLASAPIKNLQTAHTVGHYGTRVHENSNAASSNNPTSSNSYFYSNPSLMSKASNNSGMRMISTTPAVPLRTGPSGVPSKSRAASAGRSRKRAKIEETSSGSTPNQNSYPTPHTGFCYSVAVYAKYRYWREESDKYANGIRGEITRLLKSKEGDNSGTNSAMISNMSIKTDINFKYAPDAMLQTQSQVFHATGGNIRSFCEFRYICIKFNSEHYYINDGAGRRVPNFKRIAFLGELCDNALKIYNKKASEETKMVYDYAQMSAGCVLVSVPVSFSSFISLRKNAHLPGLLEAIVREIYMKSDKLGKVNDEPIIFLSTERHPDNAVQYIPNRYSSTREESDRKHLSVRGYPLVTKCHVAKRETRFFSHQSLVMHAGLAH